MASIFRMKNRPNWMVAFLDGTGRRLIRSSGSTDKRVAERFARDLEKRSLLVREGLADPRKEAIAIAARKPLAAHVDDFLKSLRDKGSTPKHVSDREGQLDRLLRAGRMTRLADLTPARVQAGLAELRELRSISIRTLNRYQRAAQSLSRWLVREGRLDADPLVAMSGRNPAPDRRHVRRALSPEEVGKLLAAAASGSEHRGLTGPDRAVLYRIALGTGFRASEIASLTPASFDLEGDPPTVTVRAGYSKNRREAVQPIRRDLADLLRGWVAEKPADRPVFDVPSLCHRTARMMRFDLDAAGIEYRDEQGRVCDFHSLRVTFISGLVSAGASVKEAQLLARHSDPALTIGTYTRASVEDLGRALEQLPRYGT